MNLRIGAFGRQESAAMVLIAAFFSGCFAADSRLLFENGNASWIIEIISTIQALLLFEATVWALRVRGGNDLSALIGDSRIKRALAVFLMLALLLAAMQPLQRFLLTMTQYVFVESKHVTACLYLLPCLFLLTALGAETLVRTARILLPILLVSIAAALLSGVGQYHLYRIHPIPLSEPAKVFTLAGSAQIRAAPPLLALLCIGEGTQDRMAMRSAGRIGAIAGGALAALALFALSMTFTYTQLKDMPAPFYRMLVEVRAENPTLRLDRAVLFLWLGGAVLTSAFYLYAACVLFCKTFRVRDSRPVALCLSGIASALILVLFYETETTAEILEHLYRDAWMLIGLPFPLILLKPRRRKTKCAASV
ncbi:MAG: GerAB/ArcD/ProY family transporter [Clostridia bacterium]|nr:GerAB/ArcD/ProY family transporter [Clostridia bacterium]